MTCWPTTCLAWFEFKRRRSACGITTPRSQVGEVAATLRRLTCRWRRLMERWCCRHFVSKLLAWELWDVMSSTASPEGRRSGNADHSCSIRTVRTSWFWKVPELYNMWWNFTELCVFHSSKILLQFKIIQRKLVCGCALRVRRKEEKVLVESWRICRGYTAWTLRVQWFTFSC